MHTQTVLPATNVFPAQVEASSTIRRAVLCECVGEKS